MKKKEKGKYLIWIIPSSVILFFQFFLSINPAILDFYTTYIYEPLQNVRNYMFNGFEFNFGDAFYIFLILLFLFYFIKLVILSFYLQKNKALLFSYLKKFGIFILFFYASFLILWGGNYSRKSFNNQTYYSKDPLTTKQLIILNEFLIEKLNTLRSEPISYQSLNKLNQISSEGIKKFFPIKIENLKVKNSNFGYLLNYIGIHGYYNPFSGESQFNKNIPAFLHPFVITHEMAHQIGIAKEDDANLLAYLIGRESENLGFRYSSYFNIFMYAFGDMKKKDKDLAEQILTNLNKQSLEDMEELMEMYKQYKSIFRKFSNNVYEQFLIIQGQEKGLRSYNQIIKWVYYLEVSE